MSTDVHWTAFKPEWYRYYKKQTGKRFNFENVNGNCALVADLYRQYLKNGENQYGFFTGEITHPSWARGAWTRHGWLKIKEVIVDPTRWCFLVEEEPRLCMTETRNDDYDLGMNKAKEKMLAEYRRFIPDYDPTKKVACDQPDLLWKFNGKVDMGRLFWIANRAPGTDAFTDEEERLRIFEWLESSGHSAFIPFDNRVSRNTLKSLLDL